MELKEKLVALRKESGLTQLAVAEKLDVSRQAISRWESGTALPSTDNLKSLSALYGVPVDYLINDDATRYIQPIQTDQPVQTDKGTTERKRKRLILACMFFVISIVAAILIVTAYRESKSVDFNTAWSEDWSDSETEEIPIRW